MNNKTTTTTIDSNRACSIFGIGPQVRKQINGGATVILFKYGRRVDISLASSGLFNIERQK